MQKFKVFESDALTVEKSINKWLNKANPQIIHMNTVVALNSNIVVTVIYK